jgi:hypothetical protein
VTTSPGHASRRTAFTLAFAALVWCAFLAPVVIQAHSAGNDEEPRAWVAALTGLHDLAESVAGAHVDEIFGALTALVYLLLAASLRVARPAGTALLPGVLVVAGLADALAYTLPDGISGVAGTVEFLGLPLLLVCVGWAAWVNRRAWPVAAALGAGLVLAVAGTAALDYWPHGLLAGVALACCGLTAWAPASDRDPLLARQHSRDRA